MESGTFDRLTRTLRQGSSRRALLMRLAGGGATAALAALGLREVQAGSITAAATPRRRRNRRHHRKTTPPPAPPDPNGSTPPPVTCDTLTGVPTGGAVAPPMACPGGNPATCSTGYCSGGLCATCPNPCVIGGVFTYPRSVCCPDGSQCLNGMCRANCVQPAAVLTRAPEIRRSPSSRTRRRTPKKQQ